MSIRVAKAPGLALVTLGLSTALLGAACGTTAPARNEADMARAVESLRAQNVAYAKKVEELENQVFLLNGELDARRPGRAGGRADTRAGGAAAGLARGEAEPHRARARARIARKQRCPPADSGRRHGHRILRRCRRTHEQAADVAAVGFGHRRHRHAHRDRGRGAPTHAAPTRRRPARASAAARSTLGPPGGGAAPTPTRPGCVSTRWRWISCAAVATTKRWPASAAS